MSTELVNKNVLFATPSKMLVVHLFLKQQNPLYISMYVFILDIMAYIPSLNKCKISKLRLHKSVSVAFSLEETNK